MTRKLFWEDAYAAECKARVVRKEGNRVVLDQSVFFAFSGGQESDSGTINDVRVAEAIKQGDDIEYVLEEDPGFSEGEEVTVKIDWEKRYKLMKLHSAAHIVFLLYKEKTGEARLIGSNVSIDKARIDFERDEPVTPLLPELEEKTNEITTSDHVIKTYEDPEKPGYRWWECCEWRIPCGGTHPKNSKEIGRVKLKRKNIGKGKERIEITLAE